MLIGTGNRAQVGMGLQYSSADSSAVATLEQVIPRNICIEEEI